MKLLVVENGEEAMKAETLEVDLRTYMFCGLWHKLPQTSPCKIFSGALKKKLQIAAYH